MTLAGYGPYYECIKATLAAALSVIPAPSQDVERHNVPEVEVRASADVLLNPIVIAKDKEEKVLIEPSINSVRVSVCWKKSDETDRLLAETYAAFLARRASQFMIMRRKPLEGWDISFLICTEHTETMLAHKLVDWIVEFLKEVNKDMKDMKMTLNSRARAVASVYFSQFAAKDLK
eukprot:TRINITY_DN68159_c0_g1_i1.p1 TRINITY_DN68159_c0_g1~~TRINITY_DN68159_c0_g1_i1.p1  ORF type:complete len:176 (+),score=32.22 TRINITY_DN68159_c0_g1_i1:163-690(+)